MVPLIYLSNFNLRILQAIIFYLSLIISVVAYSHEASFIKYNIPSLGQMSIPINMELQGGKYKELNNEYRQILSNEIGLDVQLTGNQHIFQPKGLNNFDKKAFSTYARIIAETNISKYGDYLQLSSPLSLSSEELNQINREIYQESQQSLAAINIKVIQWNGVRPVKINNQNALEISYLRQLNNNPYVVVKTYAFQNNDRKHILTFSYRQQEERLWKPLFDKTLNSFIIYRK